MGLNKVTYVDGATVITAGNLNDIQDAIISLESDRPETTTSGSMVHIANGMGSSVVELITEVNPTQSGSGTPSPSNYRTITGNDTVNIHVTPYSSGVGGKLYISNLGDTYYGGTFNVTTGVLTITHQYVLLAGSSVSSVGTASTGVKCATCSNAISGAKSNSLNLLCSSYEPTASAPQTSGFIRVSASTVYIYDNDFTDLESAQDILEAEPVQLVYELNTPQTVQLTGRTITLLNGETYVWSETGDVTVTYYATTQEYVDSVLGDIDSLLSEI